MRNAIRKWNLYLGIAKEFSALLRTVFLYKISFGKVGKKSVIFKPLRFICCHNVFVGNHVRIYKFSRIETIESWYNVKYDPRIEIGDRTTIEQFLHLTCANRIIIGNDVTILANVMITDISHAYNNINIRGIEQPLEVKQTIIGDYCTIGMGSKILPGVILGKNCIVGANSVVSGEYADYSVIAGAPAKVIKKYDFTCEKWKKVNEKGEFINEI